MEAATEKSTRTMQQKFDALGPTFKKIGMGMTVAGAAIVGSLTACVMKSVSFGDQLDKMSKRTGVSVESLSALKYAADLSGASIETVENSLRFMARAMDDASKGTGEAVETFKKLGISVTDVQGNLRPTVEVMKEAATKIAGMTNETERVAAATDIFGSRYGTQLLPLLMEGGKGIENLMNKAKDLGIVMSTEAAAKAAEFNDRLDELKASVGMVAIKIGSSLLPVIKPLIENIRDIAGRVSKWIEENPKLAATLTKVALGIGAFLTVAGPILIFLPKIIALIPILTMGFHAMLGPIGLITLAITAAVAAFTYFYTTNEKFRNFINNLGAQFKALGENIINWVMWFKDNYFKIWLTIFAGVATLAKNAAENLLTVFKWLGDSIAKWGAWFGTSFLNVWKNLFGAIQSSIMNFGKNIIAQVGWIWEKIKHPFTKVPRPDWTPLFEDFKAEWGELPKFAELKMKGMAEGMKVYWDEMPGWITPVKEATEALGDTVSAVGDAVTPVINKITGETEELTEAEKKLEEQLAKLRGEEYIRALENMIERAKEQKERTEEQEKALRDLQERLKKVRGEEYVRSVQNMILRQIEQKERTEEQEAALKALQERLTKLRGEEYIQALGNMITRQKEQKERAEEQEKALEELDKRLRELRGQEYIKALEEMIKRAKEQKERTEEQEEALKKLQERLQALRATEYIRAIQNMILRQVEQMKRTEEQEAALKVLQERLSKLRGEEYLRALENMITRQIEQKGRTEEQEKALKDFQERLTKLRGQEYIRALENMIQRATEQKERTEEQEKELKELQKLLKELRGKAYLEALGNMIKRAIEQKERTEDQEKALKKLQDRLETLRATEYIRALQNMILRQIEQKERAEEQEEALKELQERLAKLRGTEYIRALEEMITRQKEQKKRTEEQEKALRELQERLSELRGQEYIRALENMIERAKEQKERTEEQEKALKELQERLDKLRGEEYIRALKEMIKRQIEMKERTEEQEKAIKSLSETWISASSSIKSTFVGTVTSIIAGTQSIVSALNSLADAVYSTVIKAFVEWAIEAAKAGNVVAGVIAGVAAAVKILGIRIRETTTHFETAWGTLGRNFYYTTMEMSGNVEDFCNDLETQFNRVGLAISKTIEDAQYKLEGLYQSQAELGASTREQLINELDKYYDYRVLKEKSLDELLALSAETRVGIETGAIKEVEESEAEQEARRKDQAVSRLQRIEDQYRREDELIRRKIALIEIEIKFLELKMEREAHGHSQRARQLEKELDLMLEAYHKSVEAFKEAEEEKREAVKETAGETERATEDMGKSWDDLTADIRQETEKTWGKTGAIPIALGEAINAMIGKMGELPTRIDFDVIGKLRMPDIPYIGNQYFNVYGKYIAPDIPNYQTGIPYIPRPTLAILHPKEAVLSAPQAEEWRQGGTRGRSQSNTYNIRILHTGDIKTEYDKEQFLKEIADRLDQRMRRP